LLERAACLIRARRINRRVTLLYVTDDPIFVYDESRPAADEPRFVEDAVVFNDLSLDVGEEREGHSDVFLKPPVGCIAVNRDAQNLRVTILEVGNISLIRLQLLRSTAREGEHVKS